MRSMFLPFLHLNTFLINWAHGSFSWQLQNWHFLMITLDDFIFCLWFCLILFHHLFRTLTFITSYLWIKQKCIINKQKYHTFISIISIKLTRKQTAILATYIALFHRALDSFEWPKWKTQFIKRNIAFSLRLYSIDSLQSYWTNLHSLCGWKYIYPTNITFYCKYFLILRSNDLKANADFYIRTTVFLKRFSGTQKESEFHWTGVKLLNAHDIFLNRYNKNSF